MHHHYSDIRSRAGVPPVWFDEHAVPRYCAFGPDMKANIYALEVVLLAIECQGCGYKFDVCMSWSLSSSARGMPPLSEQVEENAIHYGDPPNIQCCPGGPTMNSIPRRVKQFWCAVDFEFERQSKYERAIECSWADSED